MERTRLFYDVSDFIKSKIQQKIPFILGRPPSELTKDVILPQIMITYGILQDNRVLITFHVSETSDKEEELKGIVDRLTEMIEKETADARYYIYDYGRTKVLHPTIDGKEFIQKLCHFAARPK